MKIELYQKTITGFERIATVYKTEEIDYCKTLFDEGEFNYQIPLEAQYTELMKKDVLVKVDSEFWGVILYTKRTANENGTVLNVTGIDLKTYILRKRAVIPPAYTTVDGTAGYDTASGSTETVIKHFWNNNVVSPSTSARILSNVAVAPDLHRGLSDDKFMARGNELDKLTREMCESAKIGYKASINNDNVVLDVFEGVNRTASQNENPRAIFEISRKNVATLEHEVDKRDYKNTFYTVQSGAEFEDEALTMTYYRDDDIVSGWERDEKWIEVYSETPEAGQEYEELKYQAIKAMTSYELKESFTCEITPNSRYKELWNVGDFVTVRWIEQNLMMDTQVTAVTTSASGSETRYIAKFGNSEPKYIGFGNKIIKM